MEPSSLPVVVEDVEADVLRCVVAPPLLRDTRDVADRNAAEPPPLLLSAVEATFAEAPPEEPEEADAEEEEEDPPPVAEALEVIG